jgi:phage baseplate assembly protein W
MTSFAYPPQAANGRLVLSDNAAAEAIRSAIQTKLGERILRNTYGSDVDELTTATDLDVVLAQLQEAILDSCAEYLPLAITLSGSILESGQTEIQILYNDTETITTVI